jgi:hypothetical protein
MEVRCRSEKTGEAKRGQEKSEIITRLGFY